MIRLVTRGRFTRDYAKRIGCCTGGPRTGCAQADSEPGQLVNFYFTTGDADFLLITETDEAKSAIAALLATAAAGTISDVTT